MWESQMGAIFSGIEQAESICKSIAHSGAIVSSKRIGKWPLQGEWGLDFTLEFLDSHKMSFLFRRIDLFFTGDQWVYNRQHALKVRNLIHFDGCAHPWSNHYNQDNEYFQHQKVSFSLSSLPPASPPLAFPKATTDVISVPILVCLF